MSWGSIHIPLFKRKTLQPHALSEPLDTKEQASSCKKNSDKSWNYKFRFFFFWSKHLHLHAVCEHDANSHQFGEDSEKLRVGQHAVLQAVVQEAGVVAENVINV